MTLKQRTELLAQIQALVGEHCHAFHFVAEVDIDERQETGLADTCMICTWHGGPTLVQGLVTRAKINLEEEDRIRLRQRIT